VSRDWAACHDTADLLLTDISAVASDWMTTGRPVIVTVPVSPDAFVDVGTVLDAVPNLGAAEAANAAELVRREMAGGDESRRRSWVEHTMGDIAAGASLRRFLDVCDELVALRTHELADRAVRIAGERR
jgi:CDP-glycerol glycerophosphotransferase (TagB/SpsB family)